MATTNDVERHLPNTTVHPFGAMKEDEVTERTPLITPPPTVWTKFNARFRFGKWILLGLGILGVFLIMFIVIGTLGVFKNQRYRNEAGISIGKPKYPGNSSGAWATNNMSGQGDGTYYGEVVTSLMNIQCIDKPFSDPGVGVTACGTFFTAEDYVVAMVILSLFFKKIKYSLFDRMNMISVNLIIQTIVLHVVVA